MKRIILSHFIIIPSLPNTYPNTYPNLGED